jgi:hypothetical protein
MRNATRRWLSSQPAVTSPSNSGDPARLLAAWRHVFPARPPRGRQLIAKKDGRIGGGCGEGEVESETGVLCREGGLSACEIGIAAEACARAA